MTLPTYASFKPSPSPRIPSVPSHWTSARLKAVLSERITDGPHSTPEFLDDGVAFLSVDAIQDGDLNFDACRFISDEDHREFSKKARPRFGDLLMGKAASTGKIARVKTDEAFSIWSPLALIRIANDRHDPGFYEYFLKSANCQAEIDDYCTSNTQKNISMTDIAKLSVLIPPLSEQRQIANYLDRETAQIDNLIEAQQQLIDTLRERRATMVDSVVWSGLDESAMTSPTGVDPVPLAPKHWLRRRNKDILRESTKLSEGGSEELLTVSHLTGITTRASKSVNMIEAESLVGYRLVEKSDLVINTMWAWMGALGVSTIEGVASPAYGVYRPTAGVDFHPAYFDYLYRSRPYIVEMTRHSRGIWESRLRLYPDVFLRLPIVIPPLHEQLQIAAYLDEQTARIDTLITEAERFIELSRERRSALITAAVTGQIDVREEVA